MGHAEAVPTTELDKASADFFYLPMDAVWKESRTTMNVLVVFDASVKSKFEVSLNDRLLVGPTVNACLIVLFGFRQHIRSP